MKNLFFLVGVFGYLMSTSLFADDFPLPELKMEYQKCERGNQESCSLIIDVLLKGSKYIKKNELKAMELMLMACDKQDKKNCDMLEVTFGKGKRWIDFVKYEQASKFFDEIRNDVLGKDRVSILNKLDKEHDFSELISMLERLPFDMMFSESWQNQVIYGELLLKKDGRYVVTGEGIEIGQSKNHQWVITVLRPVVYQKKK